MTKAVVIFLLSLFSSFLIAKDLDLTHNTSLDPYYCDNNPVECQPLPSIISNFEIQPDTTRSQWTIFWSLQVLDAFTTAKAVKYDCVKEINPFFTERPSELRVITTKSILLVPTIIQQREIGFFTRSELISTNILYAMVVANNIDHLNDAKQNCNKIR